MVSLTLQLHQRYAVELSVDLKCAPVWHWCWRGKGNNSTSAKSSVMNEQMTMLPGWGHRWTGVRWFSPWETMTMLPGWGHDFDFPCVLW